MRGEGENFFSREKNFSPSPLHPPTLFKKSGVLFYDYADMLGAVDITVNVYLRHATYPTLFKKRGLLFFMILRMCLVRWIFGDFYFRYVPGVIPYFSLKILEK